MNVMKLLSQGLFGLALALAMGALMSAPVTQARAATAPAQCLCVLDSCTPLPGGGCCNGFCNCVDNCGCVPYTPPGGIPIAVCALVP